MIKLALVALFALSLATLAAAAATLPAPGQPVLVADAGSQGPAITF